MPSVHCHGVALVVTSGRHLEVVKACTKYGQSRVCMIGCPGWCGGTPEQILCCGVGTTAAAVVLWLGRYLFQYWLLRLLSAYSMLFLLCSAVLVI